jgi:alpha-methylacyl-CoA racemase
MVDGVAAMAGIFQGLRAAGGLQPERGANLLDGGAPFYACYQAACGRYLAVAALEPKFFAALAEGVGLEAAYVQGQHDRSLWPAMRQALTAVFKTRSCDDWCARLAGRDACVTPVLNWAEAPRHVQATARSAYAQAGGFDQPVAAPRFSRSRARTPDAQGNTGQPREASARILQDAGLTATEINQLIEQGVVQ